VAGPQEVVASSLPPVTGGEEATSEPAAIPRRLPPPETLPSVATSETVPAANVTDSTALPGAMQAPLPAGVSISTSFDGLDSTDNTIALDPPDPQIAVGPSRVVEFVNVVGRITDKSGASAVSDFPLESFFSVPPAYSGFDPKIIYDDLDDRFFAAFASTDDLTSGAVHFAVSQSSDPTGAWNVYSLTLPGGIPDYPGIAVTNDKFTISYNRYAISDGHFLGEQTLVVQKSDVVAGLSPDTFLFPVNSLRFTVRPAQNLSPGNDQFMTTFKSSTTMTVLRITGTPEGGDVSVAAATDLTVIPQMSPPASLTAGLGEIDSGDRRMLEAVWRDDSLWSSASAACIPPGDSVVRSCAHLIEVATLGSPVVSQDIMFGAPFEYRSWPAIRTDSSGNLHVSLTGSHAGAFASAMTAGRLASDPPNTISSSCLLKAGEVVHAFPRWGDYMGAAVDPADPSTVWVVGEYAKNDGRVDWGTYIGSLSGAGGGSCLSKSLPPPPPVVAVDCDAGTAGVQASCSYPSEPPWNRFTIQVHVTSVPPGGYFAHQVKLRWEVASVAYLPAPFLSDENRWPSCTLPLRFVSPPGLNDPPGFTSVLFGCLPIPELTSGETATGAILQFQMQCQPGVDADSPLGLVARFGDPQQGTLFLVPPIFLNSIPVDPVLEGATVHCGGAPDPTTVDTDGDGCSDAEEMGSDPALGGQRGRFNEWDFFDTPVLDGAVTIGDLAQVLVHFGATVDSWNYSTAYDRSLLGLRRWNLGPPDGSTTITDIGYILGQFGHACQGPV
jgi:hypothetical protein